MSVKPRSPFEPFTTVIGICAGLYAVAFAFGLFSAILGWGRPAGVRGPLTSPEEGQGVPHSPGERRTSRTWRSTLELVDPGRSFKQSTRSGVARDTAAVPTGLGARDRAHLVSLAIGRGTVAPT
jgi:hypothetical protein